MYLVGRNSKQAEKIIEEMQESNLWADVRFLKKDVPLLLSVDEACIEIKEENREVNLLFMSPGVSKGGDSM